METVTLLASVTGYITWFYLWMKLGYWLFLETFK